MGVHSFDDLAMHVGHDVHVAQYVTFDELGEMRVANVAIECETCYEVLLDYDAPPRKKTISVCHALGACESRPGACDACARLASL